MNANTTTENKNKIVITKENFNAIFSDIAKYRLIIEEAKTELDALENSIKEYMQNENIETLTGLEHKASYKAITSNRLDTKALKLDHPAMYEKYSKANTSYRFNFA